jgi:hypothetical protein
VPVAFERNDALVILRQTIWVFVPRFTGAALPPARRAKRLASVTGSQVWLLKLGLGRLIFNKIRLGWLRV